MKNPLLILLFLPLLFASCSKDDKGGATPVPTSTPQSVYSVIDISNATPDATYHFNAHSSPTNIQVPSGSFSYTSDTWDLNWLSGNTFHYGITLYLTTTPAVIGCSDIEIRTYHNTTLINTENFQIGYTSISPIVYCDNLVAQNQFYKQIAIIAD